jgi:hypothetical protein
MHQGKFETVTIAAGADLSARQYKAIAIGGTIAATSTATVGLLQNRPAAVGRSATLGYHGQMKGYAGAAISAGAQVQVTASGYLITSTSNGNTIGVALTAAASGALFPGLFNFIAGDA